MAKASSQADLDAAVAIAKEAGFDVSKADWLNHQAKQTMDLSDEELEGAAGGATAGAFCDPIPAVRKTGIANGCGGPSISSPCLK